MEPIKAVKGNLRPVYKGVDYTGQSFGAWKVLGPITCERATGNNYKTRWLCQCSCGSDPQYVTKESLIKGTSSGCSACYGVRNSGSSNPNWKGFGEITGSILNQVRVGAKARDLELQLIAEDLDKLWKLQVGRCALSGVQLVLGDSASLDRIDSNLGYLHGNVQWVHKTLNRMKHDLPESEFVHFCRLVANHLD